MFISHQELSTSPTTGKVGNPLWQIGNQIRKAGCFIWNNYANNWTTSVGGNSLIRPFWNSLCNEPPINQNVNKPQGNDFNGGRCNAPYHIFGTYTSKNSSGGGGCDQFAYWRTNAALTGPGFTIKPRADQPLIARVFPDNPASLGQDFGYITPARYNSNDITGNSGSGTGMRIRNPGDTCDNTTAFSSGFNFIITKVIRTDGVPDNCGNGPSFYPPVTPPSEITFDIEIKEDNSKSFNFPLTWNGDFNLPLVFNNDFLTVNLDFGGVNVNWKGDRDLPDGQKNPFPTLPPVSRPPWSRPPGGGGNNPSPGDEGVNEDPPEDVSPEEPIEKEDTPEQKIIWVKIEVITPPPDRFTIKALDIEDYTYFPGYLAWTKNISGDKYSLAPEIPIRRKKTIIRKPDDVNGYKIRAINGATLKVTQYIEAVILE